MGKQISPGLLIIFPVQAKVKMGRQYHHYYHQFCINKWLLPCALFFKTVYWKPIYCCLGSLDIGYPDKSFCSRGVIFWWTVDDLYWQSRQSGMAQKESIYLFGHRKTSKFWQNKNKFLSTFKIDLTHAK